MSKEIILTFLQALASGGWSIRNLPLGWWPITSDDGEVSLGMAADPIRVTLRAP
jgi:hypothetical protein